MSAVVGRIRPCNLFDVRMTVTSHNTIIGKPLSYCFGVQLLVLL